MNIETKLQEFKDLYLPEDFAWRRGQKEAITQIIETYYEGKKKVVILDAPVGSGKSIIAMACSWILNQDGKEGYILASDVALQEQYEKDFKKFNLRWGSIKGLDNYYCNDNGEKLSVGTCKISGKDARKMHCYSDCTYYSARDEAKKRPTTLMNYAYWLIMQNLVNGTMNDPIFPPRNFTICDEGHKIVDIVQSQYSPKITEKTTERISKLTDFFNNHNVVDHSVELREIEKLIDLIKDQENQDILLEHIIHIAGHLRKYIPSMKLLKGQAKKEFEDAQPPKSWKRAMGHGEYIIDLYTKLISFAKIIKQTSTRNLVKNPQMNGDIIFNCLEENYLMNAYFHQWTGFSIFMSATFGDAKEYLKQIGVANAKYIKLDSTFNFDKSPIYYYNQRRMSFKHLEANLPWLYDTINSVLDEHKGENGIIHTASYNLTLKIYEGLSKENRKRVLIYEGSEEKRNAIEQMKVYKDKILMGPSLLEGIDLKHDWSRFQIFAKVPYLSLADRFVKAKLDLNPGWYRSKAILNILQGIGRSIRSEEDWAVTYIMDASLSDLIRQHQNAFSGDFMKRLRIRKE